VLVRTFCGAFCVLVLAVPVTGQTPAQGTTTSTTQTAVTQDEIVLQGDTTPRPALPTFYGDTGLWLVSTAETMPAGRWSFSAFRANWDRRQGLTDVNQIGLTGAFALGDRVEVFGSWRTIRLDRDVRPTFIPTEPVFGGVSQEYPYLRRGWSKTLGGPVIVGGKFNLVSQSRGDAVSLAPRVMVKFPSGYGMSGQTNETDNGIVSIGVPSTAAASKLIKTQMLTNKHEVEGNMTFFNRAWAGPAFLAGDPPQAVVDLMPTIETPIFVTLWLHGLVKAAVSK